VHSATRGRRNWQHQPTTIGHFPARAKPARLAKIKYGRRRTESTSFSCEYTRASNFGEFRSSSASLSPNTLVDPRKHYSVTDETRNSTNTSDEPKFYQRQRHILISRQLTRYSELFSPVCVASCGRRFVLEDSSYSSTIAEEEDLARSRTTNFTFTDDVPNFHEAFGFRFLDLAVCLPKVLLLCLLTLSNPTRIILPTAPC
jgi:hypothetical protein